MFMTRWCDHKIVFTLDRPIGDSGVTITFRQCGRVVCEFTDSDERVAVDGDTVTLTMKPEDTQLFTPSFATVQLNLLSSGVRTATEIMRLHIHDNLCMHDVGEVSA